MDTYKKNYKLAKSNIHGTGLHTNCSIKKHHIIGVAISFKLLFYPHITEDLGRWINHSYKPNSFIFYYPVENIYFLIAYEDLPENTEITMDYRDTPWYIKKPEFHYK